MNEIVIVPCWYKITAICFTLFHVVRGAIGQTYFNTSRDKLNWWQQTVVLYIHDFLLHSLCCLLGFIALFVAYNLCSCGLSTLPTPIIILIISLSLIGIAGITGQLASILSQGKLPLP